MFCTVCATANPAAEETCPACGALLNPSPAAGGHHGTAAQSARSRRDGVVRALYALPVILLLLLAGGAAVQAQRQQAALTAAYESADASERVRDFPAAVTGFTDLGAFRDAPARREQAARQLQPFRVAYDEGISALNDGDYAKAVDLLAPVAKIVPSYRDVVIRLADARHLLAGDLWRSVDAATSRRDWVSAEASLRRLQADVGDPDAGDQLATLYRDHGPLVLGRDHDLWLAGIDGADDRLVTDQAPALWPAWSPDRTRVAFMTYDPQDPTGNVSLCVVNVDGSGFRQLADNVSAHAPPLWSPDGERIAYTSFSAYDPILDTGPIGVRFYDLPTDREVDLTGSAFSLAFNPAWSPDGKQIAFVTKDRAMTERPQEAPGEVMLATLGRSGFRDLTNGSVRDVWSVAWSPVRSELLVYSLVGQTWYEPPATALRLLDPRTGTLRVIDPGDQTLGTPQWSPDGDAFAFTRGNTTLVVVRNGLQTAIELQVDLSGDLTWSPDGQALLVLPIDPTVASQLVELDKGTSVRPISLQFDADRPFYAPPQWAPATPMLAPLGRPTVGGTTLDASEMLRSGG